MLGMFWIDRELSNRKMGFNYSDLLKSYNRVLKLLSREIWQHCHGFPDKPKNSPNRTQSQAHFLKLFFSKICFDLT